MDARRAPLPEGAGARVRVYSRQGCHLCEEALAVVEAVCREADEGWEVVDVDADPTLKERYNDHVPVTVVDGHEVGMWFLAPETLRAALAR